MVYRFEIHSWHFLINALLNLSCFNLQMDSKISFTKNKGGKERFQSILVMKLWSELIGWIIFGSEPPSIELINREFSHCPLFKERNMLIAERFLLGVVKITVNILFQMMDTSGYPPEPLGSSNSITLSTPSYRKVP